MTLQRPMLPPPAADSARRKSSQSAKFSPDASIEAGSDLAPIGALFQQPLANLPNVGNSIGRIDELALNHLSPPEQTPVPLSDTTSLPGQPSAANPTMSRRVFMSLASVATAATAIASPSIASALPSAEAGTKPAVQNLPAEDPRIIELGEKIDPLLRSYQYWAAREVEAYATYLRLRPPIPEELLTAHKQYSFISDCRAEESDCRGFKECETYIDDDGREYANRPRRILKSKPLRIFIIERDLGRSTKWERDIRRLARLAASYERAVQEALVESDYDNIENKQRSASYELERLVYDLRELEPNTISGALIFARALTAFQEAESCAGKIIGGSAQLLGSKLAAAVLRVSG